MQLNRIIYNFSAKLMFLLSKDRVDHLTINGFNLGSFYDMRSHFILWVFIKDGFAVEEYVLNFGEPSNLGDNIESLDIDVGDKEECYFNERLLTIQLFDLI